MSILGATTSHFGVDRHDDDKDEMARYDDEEDHPSLEAVAPE